MKYFSLSIQHAYQIVNSQNHKSVLPCWQGATAQNETLIRSSSETKLAMFKLRYPDKAGASTLKGWKTLPPICRRTMPSKLVFLLFVWHGDSFNHSRPRPFFSFFEGYKLSIPSIPTNLSGLSISHDYPPEFRRGTP